MAEPYSKEEIQIINRWFKTDGAKEPLVHPEYGRFLATIKQRDEVIESLTANIKQLLYPETKEKK